MVGSPVDVNGIELETFCLCYPYFSIGETLGRMKKVALAAHSNRVIISSTTSQLHLLATVYFHCSLAAVKEVERAFIEQ